MNQRLLRDDNRTVVVWAILPLAYPHVRSALSVYSTSRTFKNTPHKIMRFSITRSLLLISNPYSVNLEIIASIWKSIPGVVPSSFRSLLATLRSPFGTSDCEGILDSNSDRASCHPCPTWIHLKALDPRYLLKHNFFSKLGIG